jgi:hypothetical protein
MDLDGIGIRRCRAEHNARFFYWTFEHKKNEMSS